MSKENKFHNLIERENGEEKKRVWEELRAKESEQQTAYSTQTAQQKPVRSFFTRKFLSWAGAAAVALLLCVVGITQFIPHFIPNKGAAPNDGGMPPTENGDQMETDNNQAGTTPETSVEENLESLDSRLETNESHVEEETPDAPEMGEDTQWIPQTSYEEKRQTTTLQENENGLLYLDWYEKDYQSVAFVEKTTGKILGYKETFTAEEIYGEVVLYTTAADVHLEELAWGKELTVWQPVKDVLVSSAFWLVRPNDPLIKKAMLYFTYEGNQYYLTVEGNIPDREYVWELVKSILP